MNWHNLTDALLSVGLPTLLVGGALVGSTLKPGLRRRIETYVLMPAFVCITGALTALAAVRHWWAWLAVFAVAFAFAIERMIRRVRENRQAAKAVSLNA